MMVTSSGQRERSTFTGDTAQLWTLAIFPHLSRAGAAYMPLVRFRVITVTCIDDKGTPEVATDDTIDMTSPRIAPLLTTSSDVEDDMFIVKACKVADILGTEVPNTSSGLSMVPKLDDVISTMRAWHRPHHFHGVHGGRKGQPDRHG